MLLKIWSNIKKLKAMHLVRISSFDSHFRVFPGHQHNNNNTLFQDHLHSSAAMHNIHLHEWSHIYGIRICMHAG